ncbi:MAG TPA: H-X9-DG-CTERM domain-containing protein, partial [Chthonomonadales bacterium]|nr:H-X9-DG-CTERM domain-containing protein [Chthonomonadales bacterium]
IKNGNNQALLTSGRTIQGYAGGIFSCPSAFRPNQQDQFVLRCDVFPVWYNETNPLPTGASGPSVTQAQIDTPSDRIGFWEAGSNGFDTNDFGPYYPIDGWAWYSGYAYQVGSFLGASKDCDQPTGVEGGGFQSCNTLPRYRHTSGCNMFFLDGHVKVMHKTDWYAQNLFIPGLCESYWETCSPTP